MYCVYILECVNGSLYTGYTTDLQRRYEEHLEGTAKCKYTRSFKPRRIAQHWRVPEKSLALKLERYLKSLSKAQKLHFIANPELLGVNCHETPSQPVCRGRPQ